MDLKRLPGEDAGDERMAVAVALEAVLDFLRGAGDTASSE
jgi:hypothetical protein